jgi:hypothetical protein
MTRRLPFLVVSLLLVAIPLLAQRAPIIRVVPSQFEEIGAVSEPPLIPAVGGQTHPTVASNGEGWLVAWSDTRYGDSSDSIRAEDVFATIVSPSGVVVHPEGLPVSPTWASDRYPSAVWTGSSYLVVWSSPIGLFGAHLDGNGSFLRSGLLAENSELRSMEETAIARSGERLLVLWSERGADLSFAIRWLLLDDRGVPLTDPATLVAPSFGSQRNPSVAAAGDGFVVAWEELSTTESRVFATTVTPAGVVSAGTAIGAGPDRISPLGTWASQAMPNVATAGGGALIVWTDGSVRARSLGYGVSGIGEIVTIPSEKVALAPAIAATRNAWEILWSEGEPGPGGNDGSSDISSLDLVSVSLSGSFSLGTRNTISAAAEAQVGVAAASNGEEVFAAWTDFARSRSTDHWYRSRFVGDLFGVRLGDGRAPELVARSRAEQRPLGIAALDGVVRALWIEDVDDDEEAIATRAFRADGTPLDEARLVGKGNRFVTAGAIAASGERFGIVFSTGEETRATQIDVDGRISIDAVLVASDGDSSAIASDGRDFLIAWGEEKTLSPIPIPDLRVKVAAFTADGSVGQPAEVGGVGATHPGIVWTGIAYFVVWVDVAPPPGWARNTAARFVSTAGIPLGDGPKYLEPRWPYPAGYWGMASNGEEIVVSLFLHTLRIGSDGAIRETRESGSMRLVWTGEVFAGAASANPWTSPPVTAIAATGPREVIGIAAKEITPLPLAHENTISRVVLSRAHVRETRQRTALRE